MLYAIEDLVAALKQGRIKKGLSQRALSAKTGIPQNHISKIEQGIVDLQATSLVALARALDLELVIVSKQLLSTVEALQKGSAPSEQVPAYRLEEE